MYLGSPSTILCLVLASSLPGASAFSTPAGLASTGAQESGVLLFSANDESNGDTSSLLDDNSSRRNVVSSLGLIGAGSIFSAMTTPFKAKAEEDFASIAARANKISKEIETSTPTSEIRKTDKTMYDFTLPVEGRDVQMMDIIRQKFDETGNNAKVKAVLVVNIKQDDPTARKDIPEFISLVTK